MQTVQEAYTAHRLMPALQLHQLRVAGVGQIVSRALSREIDERHVVLACLFHDMGNIIKSDLDTFPEFSEPEGVAHWQLIKDEIIARYGADEHAATVAIAHELSLEEEVIRLIDGVGFGKLVQTRESTSYEQKIVEYADLRVGPHGVLTLESRLREARGRYLSRAHSDMARLDDRFEEYLHAAHDIERQIFEGTDIGPEEITEHGVEQLFESLRGMQI
ncbi:MAG TPA: HD domain-containing protein [Candidatus Paceibacterota bacterium]